MLYPHEVMSVMVPYNQGDDTRDALAAKTV